MEHTALLVIDMQIDFCGRGGYVDKMGYDLSLTARAIAPIHRVLTVARACELAVIHTRKGHRPDLADCPPTKRTRGNLPCGIGDTGPLGRVLVRGEWGHDIIEELYPHPGDLIVDKPGKGSFYATDLDLLLHNRGITHLLVSGVTTEVCVHTTVREANDRGYECLVLSDCVGSYFPAFHTTALEMIVAQGGIFGWVSGSNDLLSALATGEQGSLP